MCVVSDAELNCCSTPSPPPPCSTHVPNLSLFLSVVLRFQAISLIKQTLAHNAEDRLLPAEMLQHPWFNMPS